VVRMLAEVRRAGPDDLDDVLALWSEGRAERAGQGRPVSTAEQLGPRLGAALATAQIEILLARRDGRPVGFIVLHETPPTFVTDQTAICIDHLYVSPAARRHGVARAMLGHVAGRAERTGAEQIVSSVIPWARETHRFFARLGFSPVTVRRSVTPSVLRRRLTGDRQRGGLEDLLSRRRSLRARAGRRPGFSRLPPEVPDGGLDDPDARLA
jgi:GNAT superfamily N-acetyltransferase